MIYTSIDQMVGETPLLELCNLERDYGLQAKVLAKLEAFNPAGSVKDRAVLSMLNDAEERGLLSPGGTIIEPTSGNTGIALCALAARRGYRVIIVMPDSMSIERRQMMQAYGGELRLTPGAKGMAGAVEEAERLKAELPGSIIIGQFVNPANPLAHETTTGPELWRDTGGKIDLFVAGVGTGGTITGVGRFLKAQKSRARIVAVEPAASPLLSEGKAGPHGLQGIGPNFVPETLDSSVCDLIFPVTEAQAYEAARALAKREGVLAGISSGAALHAALELARQPEQAGKTIVVLLPDTGDRYFSTPLYSE